MKIHGVLCLFLGHEWLKVGPFTKQCQRCELTVQTRIGAAAQRSATPPPVRPQPPRR